MSCMNNTGNMLHPLGSGYDGGDCCECTCVSTSEHTCGDEEFGGFECLDPKAQCSDDADHVVPDHHDDSSPCLDHFIGDGDCDSANNNEECGKSKFLNLRRRRTGFCFSSASLLYGNTARLGEIIDSDNRFQLQLMVYIYQVGQIES